MAVGCDANAPGAQALAALMVAAAALPAVAPGGLRAEGLEAATFQYGQYEDGGRPFWTGPTGTLKPPASLRVDMMRANARFGLSDRTTFGMEFQQDTWSGATPYITTPTGFVGMTGASAYVAADKAGAAARVTRNTLIPLNLTGTPLVQRADVVNLMTSASAETRHQARFNLTHEWDEAAVTASAGLSEEPDYRSKTFGLSGRRDFNGKLTSLSLGVARTESRIDAKLGPQNAYIDYDLYTNPRYFPSGVGTRIAAVDSPGLVTGAATGNTPILYFRGNRADNSATVGLTQVLSKTTVISIGSSYSRSAGFLESPHKLVLMGFANPATPPIFNYLATTLFTLPEKRPARRTQVSWNVHLAQYLPGPDAALHLDYSQSSDDWGVQSKAYEIKWVQPIGRWTVTPRFRYYTQTAATFYQPYFLFRQAYPKDLTTPGLLDLNKLPVQYWSSDQRLSAYGARTVGLIISRRLTEDTRLEMALEEYQHAGWLKDGGGGEGGFGDYRARMFNVALAMEFGNRAPGNAALPRGRTGASAGESHDDHHDHAEHMEQAGHDGHAGHAGMDAPAGVMGAHFMDAPGSLMFGYSYQYTLQKGPVLGGSSRATDAAILASCGTAGCPTTPREMAMHMHMFHVMYAPSRDVNLMLMPQLMSMTMKNRILDGGFYTPVGGHVHDDMDLTGHATGGIGDTYFGAQVRLHGWRDGRLVLGLGMTAPTGSINKRMPAHGNELMDYGMQLGSGTWDFMPSLTYSGERGRWRWGVQVGRTLRFRGPNDNGYTLGNVTQRTAWLGYRVSEAISASLRAAFSSQGAIAGRMSGSDAVVDAQGNVSYPKPIHSSTDIASNYGGRFTEVGLGVSLAVPGRAAHGERINLEVILPTRQIVNGFQLQRAGAFALTWNTMF